MNDKFVLCFYSTPSDNDVSCLLDRSWGYALDFFSKFDVDIKSCSYGLGEKVRGLKAFELYDFRRVEKKARSEIERGNLRHFSFYDVEKGDSKSPAFDWDILFDCGVFMPMGIFIFQLGVDVQILDQKIGVLSNWLTDIKHEVEGYLDPIYGHGFVMPSSFLPSGYALGVMGNAPDFFLYDVNSWRKGCSHSCKSKVRNIHPLNYLNDEHIGLLNGSGIALQAKIVTGGENELSQFSLGGASDSLESLLWNNSEVMDVRRELEDRSFFPWQVVYPR
jgi:hypothetical protein